MRLRTVVITSMLLIFAHFISCEVFLCIQGAHQFDFWLVILINVANQPKKKNSNFDCGR